MKENWSSAHFYSISPREKEVACNQSAMQVPPLVRITWSNGHQACKSVNFDIFRLSYNLTSDDPLTLVSDLWPYFPLNPSYKIHTIPALKIQNLFTSGILSRLPTCRVASFPFPLKSQIPWFSMTVIFTIFWDFPQHFFKECNVWNQRSMQYVYTYTTLSDKLWSF